MPGAMEDFGLAMTTNLMAARQDGGGGAHGVAAARMDSGKKRSVTSGRSRLLFLAWLSKYRRPNHRGSSGAWFREMREVPCLVLEMREQM